MRSRTSHTISSREVHGWALNWLLSDELAEGSRLALHGVGGLEHRLARRPE